MKDLKSRNGVKVNGARITEKRVDPGDELSVARHKYQVMYSPADLGAVGPPPPEALEEDMFSKSLLERAGLEKKHVGRSSPDFDDEPHRYELHNDEPGQLKRRKDRLI